MVDVYVDIDPEANFETTPLSSFKTSTLTKMRYKEFLDMSGRNSMGMVLKDTSLSEMLLPFIKTPEFLKELIDPMGVTLLQSASGYYSPPLYERHEQFLCSVDGMVQTKLVPPIYHQEVYAGQDRPLYDPLDQDKQRGPNAAGLEGAKTEKCLANESPVNFFDPDLQNFPLYGEIERKYTVILHEGDCVFIPAFYFHQYAAKAPAGEEREGRKPAATTLILKYKAHSQLLYGFFEAIEAKLFY